MVEIRKLTTMTEMKQIQKIERRIWEMDPLPTHQTATAVKNGGLMIGAFEEDQLVGFSYGFAGFDRGRVYLCSHMLGVDAPYRSRRIGEILKRKQRELAVDKGYEEMHWTYDPLETRNAYLNLTKLNGICDTYLENCYGDMEDGLNKGLPSDRFVIHWHLNSPHVIEKHSLDIEEANCLNTVTTNPEGWPVSAECEYQELVSEVYSILVPKDFQGLKAANHDLAMDWRLKTRRLFQLLFSAGYAAVDLKLQENNGEYIFVKKDMLALGGKE